MQRGVMGGGLRGDVGSVGWKRHRGARVVEAEGLERDGGKGGKGGARERKTRGQKIRMEMKNRMGLRCSGS